MPENKPENRDKVDILSLFSNTLLGKLPWKPNDTHSRRAPRATLHYLRNNDGKRIRRRRRDRRRLDNNEDLRARRAVA